uniref:Amino acid transporter n=1 Tax=Albugo laibachii Nc14 TaxID=890382 RepID=F0W7R7_9STRA|nr:dicarboxylate/amino acid:cation (Na or H) symporter (DAACS) family protein putative [Albugo laibachii Nc14]|eukprot:CCA17169.1 dicarboxylate/amino acid:cation (Na or H) symporter (DAACS) family protein putative [Albugo laibachii Nc14]
MLSPGQKASFVVFDDRNQEHLPPNSSHPSPMRSIDTSSTSIHSKNHPGFYYERRRLSSSVLMESSFLSPNKSNEERDGSPPRFQAISVRYMVLGLFLGIALGLLVAFFKASLNVINLIALPGEIFTRAIKCIVMPYIFSAVAVASGDIMFAGKGFVIGFKTLKIFVLFWILSASLGVGIALASRSFFSLDSQKEHYTEYNYIQLRCNDAGWSLQSSPLNDSIRCGEERIGAKMRFQAKEATNLFKTHSIMKFSINDLILNTIRSMVSENIAYSLVQMETLAVVVFASFLGIVAAQNYYAKTRRINYLYRVLLQLRNTCYWALECIMLLAPIAVTSIIAGALASNQHFNAYTHAGAYVASCTIAIFLQMFLMYPIVVFTWTRCNPFAHMRFMIRAYLYAFGLSSSLAATPATLSCLQKSRLCSITLAEFIVSFGSTMNLSTSGLVIPISCMYLAESAGFGNALTVWQILSLLVLSIFSCAGVPPVPHGRTVVLVTIFTSVFGSDALPQTFATYLIADSIVDRLVTVGNVNDDALVVKIVAETTDETVLAWLHS